MRIEQLTFTRFIAAISIVIFHYGRNITPLNYCDFVFCQANMAVSYFFVLSGFVMAIAYRDNKRVHFGRFIQRRFARIYPVYDQALKNTCKLMDAQDYISGASSQFDFYLKDQMENGMYLTEEVYENIEETNITPSDSTKTVAKGKIKRRKRFRIRRDANGEIVRDASNSLKRYGLTVRQVAVTGIDWENSFDNRLQLQKEQVAQTQLEKQKAEKEYYATQKAIAQGEREKAETRVKFEKQQLEKTIAAETRAKEAKYKEQEEENLLKAAKKEAMRIKITADAEAYEISKKVHAGITPEKRLQMELDASVERMKALAGPAGIQLPTTMFTGGSTGNSKTSILESILSAKLLEGQIKK